MATVFSYLDSRAVSGRCFAARRKGESMQIQIKIPPQSLRDIVESIQAARGVTLYRESV